MATLGAPVRVSPLIKFGRWTALVTGILYGRSHFNSLKAKEAVIREEETKKQAIRDAQLAEEKLKNNKQEMIYLAGKLVSRCLQTFSSRVLGNPPLR